MIKFDSLSKYVERSAAIWRVDVFPFNILSLWHKKDKN